MENNVNVERLFDILNEGCSFLFDNLRMNYLDSLVTCSNYLLDDDLNLHLDDEDILTLSSILDEAKKLELDSETIRKAFQFLILRGFKEMNIKNGNITPETVCLLVSYIVNKCFRDKPFINVLDIAVGTGNLISAVANNYSGIMNLFGVDQNPTILDVCKANLNMQDYDIELILGDTLKEEYHNMDLIIGDIEGQTINSKYLPHEVVKHHFGALKHKGYMILVIPNEFFLKERFEIENMQMLGIIELPNMGVKKSILIIQKSTIKTRDFLMASLPSFEKMQEVNACIQKIEQWFIRRELKC